MKWILLLALVFAGFLVYRNVELNRNSDKLQWEIDSIKTENKIQLEEIHFLEVERDSLQKKNDSLQYKKTVEIYNQIEYRYGKEIEHVSASGIYECIDILTN